MPETYRYGDDWSPKYAANKLPRGLWFGSWRAEACPNDTFSGEPVVTATFRGKPSDMILDDECFATDDPDLVLFTTVDGSVGDHIVTVTVTTSSGLTKSVEMTQTILKA